MSQDGFSPLPPHSDEAEESLLGSILIDPEAYPLIAESFAPGDFYHPRNRDVGLAIQRLYEQGTAIDYTTVVDELDQADMMDRIGGQPYIISLLSAVPSAANVEHYHEIVKRTAGLRRLIQAAGQIAAIGYEGAPRFEDAYDAAVNALAAIAPRRATSQMKHILPIVEEYLESISTGEGASIESQGQRFQTDYIDLDGILGGLQRSDLVVLGARPSIGKTALALNIAWNLAVLSNITTAVFSVEMSRWQVAQRILSMGAKISATRLRNGQINDYELHGLMDVLNTLTHVPLYVDDTPGIRLEELKTRTRALHQEHPLGCIIVDYMQLVNGNQRQNRVDQVSEISRELKQLARETNACVLALSQLSRSVESRNPHIPMLSDLRESGAIEQDADVVLLMYREDVYDRASDRKGLVDVYVAKHRNGPTGVVTLLFKEQTMQFLTLGRDPELDHAEEAGMVWHN